MKIGYGLFFTPLPFRHNNNNNNKLWMQRRREKKNRKINRKLFLFHRTRAINQSTAIPSWKLHTHTQIYIHLLYAYIRTHSQLYAIQHNTKQLRGHRLWFNQFIHKSGALALNSPFFCTQRTVNTSSCCCCRRNCWW